MKSMKRIWTLAAVAMALTITMASTAEARWRLLRRPLLQQRPVLQRTAKPAAAPVRMRCMPGGQCRPQQANLHPEGAYTPLPASVLEPPLPQVVIEPADLAPTLSPRS